MRDALVLVEERQQPARGERAQYELEPGRRRRSHPTFSERSAVRITTNATTSSPMKTPSWIAVESGPLSPEKKRDSRITPPKSAIEAAASTSWPNLVVSSPTSLSTW